jgi:hypothetical protein
MHALPLILTSAVLGQYHQHAAGCGHHVQTYAAPTYGHAQTYQYNTNAFFAADPAHYASVVADYVRKQAAAAAAAAAQADQSAKLTQLNETVTRIETRFNAALAEPPAPAPQPQYQAPPLASPQQPPVPDKAPPLATPQQPYAAPTPPPFATIPDKSAPASQPRPAKFPSLVRRSCSGSGHVARPGPCQVRGMPHGPGC